MRNVRLGAWIALFAALGAAPLCARTAVSGRVVDETGAAIAGARIEFLLSGKAVVTATSDEAGSFNAALPEQGKYALRAERLGFFVFERQSQDFDGEAAQLTITLNHIQEFSESIEVAASAPGINPQDPTPRKELVNTQVQTVPYPAPQDYRNALPLMNGVLQDTSGQLHISGAGSNQTSYTLNGFNIADPITGRLEARVNTEAIQSVDLEVNRFSPESGRGSAGALDVKTKMGDDRLRFEGTNFVPGVSFDGGFHISKWTPRLQLSGPIAKGRAWFHNGFDGFYDVDVVHGLPEGQNRTRAITANNLTRAQVNLTPSHILTGSLLANIANHNGTGLSIISPMETTRATRRRLFSGSLRSQKYTRGAVFDLGFAQSRTFEKDSPRGDELFEITPSGNQGNYFVRSRSHGYRQQGIANLFLPIFSLVGEHQIKAGIDVQREAFDSAIERHDYAVLRSDSSVARRVTFEGTGRLELSNVNSAGYVQNHWALREGLGVDAGVRIEKNRIVPGWGIAPRLAGVWAPRTLPDAKLSAGWGIYYDAIALGDLARGQDQFSVSTFYLPGGEMAGAAQTAFRVDARSLRTPRYTAVSMGVEKKTPFGFYAKAEYIRRSGDRGFVFVPENDGLVTGASAGAFELRNARKDRYRALEFSLRRTFAGQYEWFAGYTRSSSRTNAAVEYRLENPVFAHQMPGPVAWDAPNRFQMWGWAPLPVVETPGLLKLALNNTTLSYLLEYRTGFPFSVVDDRGYQVGLPGAMRLPDYFNINLHLERKFRLMHYIWAWRFGFNNITNNGNPNVVNNIQGTPNFLTFGRGQARAFSVRLRLIGRK